MRRVRCLGCVAPPRRVVLVAPERAAAKRGELTDPARRRGPKPTPPDPRTHRILVLERALAKATARAEHAEALVELQKKVAELLGRTLPTADGPHGAR